MNTCFIKAHQVSEGGMIGECRMHGGNGRHAFFFLFSHRWAVLKWLGMKTWVWVIQLRIVSIFGLLWTLSRTFEVRAEFFLTSWATVSLCVALIIFFANKSGIGRYTEARYTYVMLCVRGTGRGTTEILSLWVFAKYWFVMYFKPLSVIARITSDWSSCL